MGKLPHQIDEYGDLVYSPTENPKGFKEYSTFITSSLIEYGAKAHNHEAVAKLNGANLKGKGAVVSLDFPEVSSTLLFKTSFTKLTTSLFRFQTGLYLTPLSISTHKGIVVRKERIDPQIAFT